MGTPEPDATRDADGAELDTRELTGKVFNGVAEFGRRLGELTLTNLAAISAVFAVTLDTIGLVRRVAQLHAEGVATTRGLPFDPGWLHRAQVNLTDR